MAKLKPAALKVEYLPLDALAPYARNARTHTDAQVAQIAASISEFSFANPVLIDRDGGIIAGHGRVLAARQLGMDTVPAIRLGHLSPTQRKALVIADNKLALNAGWSEDLLRLELADLQTDGFSLELTGFSGDELADLLADRTAGLTDPDDAPPAPVNPVTVLGDVWVMGKHRVHCGDSTSLDAVERLLEGRKADMVFTDPPYGVVFQSGRSKGGTAPRFDKLVNDDRILDVAPIVAATIRNDGAMFIWTSHQVYPTWREQFAEWYKQTIIWHKPGGGIGDLKGNYATDYEMCIFGMKGRAKFRDKRGMAVWRIAKDNVSDYKHPTQKPVELAERACNDFTDAGYTVLDLFGGSGSTLIACEQTGRDARLMELAPNYCDVIVNRWQDFTGQTATLEASGQTFADVCEQRFAADAGRNGAGSYDDAVAAARASLEAAE